MMVDLFGEVAEDAYYIIEFLWEANNKPLHELPKPDIVAYLQPFPLALGNAYALSLIMRTVKDDYQVNMLARAVGEPIAAWDAAAEDEFNQPGTSKGEKPDTIAYFITGVLAKVPYDNPKDVKVLEKAQAVVFTGNDKV